MATTLIVALALATAGTLAALRARSAHPARTTPATTILEIGLQPSGRGWALGGTGFAVTDDAGQHWRVASGALVPGDDAADVLDVAALGSAEYWVASYGPGGDHDVSVNRSPDDGATWQTSVVPKHGSAPVTDAHLDFATPARGWLAVRIGLTATSTLFSTADGGAAWTYVGTVPFAGPVRFFDPLRGLGVQVPGPSQRAALYRTGDGGRTWATAALPAVPAVPGNQTGTFATYDTPQIFGTTVAVVVAWLTGNDGVGTGTATPVIYTTADGGRTWQPRLAPHDASADRYSTPPFPFSAVSPTDWALYEGPMLYLTHDAGRTWIPERPSPTWLQIDELVLTGDRGWALVMHQTCHPPLGPSTGICAARTLVSTGDGGAHWVVVNRPAPTTSR